MIEKPKRPKKPDIQERQPPRTLQELVNRYDLDNTKIYDFLDGLVDLINTDISNLENQKVNKVINITSTGTNLNDYKTEGTYYFSPSYTPTNIPVGVNGWLKVISGNDGYVIAKQIWYRHGTPNSNDYETYVRTFSSNTWSNWNKLAIQSSIDNLNNNKVSKTGDTLTGELNFNNKNDYAVIRKTRTINGIDYKANFGIGANQSARIEFEDASENVLGNLEVRNGGIWNGVSGNKLLEEEKFVSVTSDFTINDQSCFKLQNSLNIGLNIYNANSTFAKATWVTIAQLPVGYRPSREKYIAGFGSNSAWTSPTAVPCLIETSGAIRVYLQNDLKRIIVNGMIIL